MVTKPWYVKKPNRLFRTSNKPFTQRNRSHVRPAHEIPSSPASAPHGRDKQAGEGDQLNWEQPGLKMGRDYGEVAFASTAVLQDCVAAMDVSRRWRSASALSGWQGASLRPSLARIGAVFAGSR
jgi:hypothetical protein